MSNGESSVTDLVQWKRPAIARLRTDMEGLIESFFTDFMGDKFTQLSIFEDLQPKSSFPKINVSESDDDYKVDIAVAGFSKDDVNLELKDGVLSIKADKKEDNEESDTSYLRREISYRSFARAVKFPCRVDPDSVDAEYKDGVINVKINKIKEEDLDCRVKIEVK